MQIDLTQTASPPDPIRSQVCIIGAGIAGLTLAHRLTRQGINVTLLEAGGLTPSATIEDQVFGGTSLRWGGQLLPLPATSTWPISAEDLQPHYRAAEQLLAVDDLPYNARAFFNANHTPTPTLFQQLLHLEPQLSKWAPFSHRNLAQTLGKELRSNPHAAIYLHARVTELLLSPNRDRIEAVLVRTPAGQTLRFEAPHIVVAAGTLETSRLLLASRSIAPEGVGNEHDQLGRNFHDHLTLPAATFTGAARRTILKTFRPWIYSATQHSLKLEASPELRRQLSLNPILAHITFEDAKDSGISLVRKLLIARQQGTLAKALRGNVIHLPAAAYQVLLLSGEAKMNHRRYIPAQTKVTLTLNAAQDTPSTSRITLSETLDPHGVPQASVEKRISHNELQTFRTFAAHLHARLRHNGASSGAEWQPALFSPDLPLQHLDDARHPMGGACMGTNPHTSVVDANLTVHGIPNLHLASAATFPGGTPQLPTLPLMALTFRLADRLLTSKF